MQGAPIFISGGFGVLVRQIMTNLLSQVGKTNFTS
jgi:hypothetical protein